MSATEGEKSLGDYLRHHREKKGITLEQVSSATKINIKILHFLESGQFSELPSKPFLRGFITAYCQFIGLDAKDTLSRYSDYIENEILGKIKNKKKYVQYSVELKEGDSSKKLISVILVGFILIGMFSYFVMKPKLKKKQETTIAKIKQDSPAVPVEVSAKQETKVEESESPAPPPPPQVEKNEAPESEKEGATETTQTLTSPASEIKEEEKQADLDPLQKGDSYPPESIRYRVVLQAKENFWVRYKVDDFETQSFILLKERYLVLKAMKSITLHLSNPEFVLIKKGQNFIHINESNQLKISEINNGFEYRAGDPKQLSEPSPLINLSPLPKLEIQP